MQLEWSDETPGLLIILAAAEATWVTDDTETLSVLILLLSLWENAMKNDYDDEK